VRTYLGLNHVKSKTTVELQIYKVGTTVELQILLCGGQLLISTMEKIGEFANSSQGYQCNQPWNSVKSTASEVTLES
jgi:hypothetical protein